MSFRCCVRCRGRLTRKKLHRYVPHLCVHLCGRISTNARARAFSSWRLNHIYLSAPDSLRGLYRTTYTLLSVRDLVYYSEKLSSKVAGAPKEVVAGCTVLRTTTATCVCVSVVVRIVMILHHISARSGLEAAAAAQKKRIVKSIAFACVCVSHCI